MSLSKNVEESEQKCDQIFSNLQVCIALTLTKKSGKLIECKLGEATRIRTRDLTREIH